MKVFYNHWRGWGISDKKQEIKDKENGVLLFAEIEIDKFDGYCVVYKSNKSDQEDISDIRVALSNDEDEQMVSYKVNKYEEKVNGWLVVFTHEIMGEVQIGISGKGRFFCGELISPAGVHMEK